MVDSNKVYLAVDLGASSGRVLAGIFDGQLLRLQEVFRFANGPHLAADTMYWNLLGLWQNIQEGLRASQAEFGEQVTSIAVDTWGVDFALLGRHDELLSNPVHHRDQRTAGILEKAFAIVPREEIFAETGLQFMEFNTLYQLLAMQQNQSCILDAAESFLMIPDLMHWLLTGVKANEITNATTTQFYNPKTKSWANGLLEKFGLPTDILGELLPPGTDIGCLRPSLQRETGLGSTRVVLPGTHDTASAVMAVPAATPPSAKPDWCYISSGTWSLMGIEVPEPIINATCQSLNFTNEGGVGGTTRVLKNIAGLWLVQECRRIWKRDDRDYSWDQLVDLASSAAPLESLINPDAPPFIAPSNMPKAIQEYCRDTGQTEPDSVGAVIRCALESLALRYRQVLGWLEDLTGSRLETIHIVGGGAQNRLLAQMTADACNRQVIAGPVEATAIGNLMMQAVAAGDVATVQDAREVIRQSFHVEEYAPRHTEQWDAAFDRFKQLVLG